MNGAGTVTENAANTALAVNLAAGVGAVNLNNVTSSASVSIANTSVTDVATVNVLQATAAVAVTQQQPQNGTGAYVQATTVTLGSGLLANFTGSVALGNIQTLGFDDSKDPANQTYGISDSGVTLGSETFSASGVQQIKLQTGLGNNTVNSTVGAANQIINAPLVFTQPQPANVLNITLAGDPSRLSLANPTAAAVAMSRFEQVNFDNSGNTASTHWTLNGNGLYNGDATSGPQVLEFVGGTAFNFKTGSGSGNVMRISDEPGATTVNLGTGTTNVMVQSPPANPLSFTGTSTNNSLTVSDSNGSSLTGVLRSLALTTNTIALGSGQPIHYLESAFGNLTVGLGPANYTATVTDLPASTTLNPGSVASTYNLSGNLNNLTLFEAGPGFGNDTINVSAGTGSISIGGGNGSESLTVDRSAAVTDLTGSLLTRSGQPVVTLTGAPTITLPATTSASQAVANLTLKLGAGNDNFTVDSAGYNPSAVSLYGGAGNDTFNFTSVGGAAGTFQVFGDNNSTITGDTGVNTLTLKVAASPTANEFSAIAPHVENVIVDNSAASAQTAWTVQGDNVIVTPTTGSAFSIINAQGAGQIQLIGGPSGKDSLNLEGDGTSAVQTTLNGNTADVNQGLSVLTQSQQPTAGPTVQSTVEGLSNPGSLAVTGDGTLSFEISGNAVYAYRTSTTGDSVAYVGATTLPVSTAASAIAVRPDGKWLFVADGTTLYVYQVNPISAALTLASSVSIPGLGAIKASPDGKNLAVVATAGILSYEIDNLTGTLGIASTYTSGSGGYTGVWFSQDSSQLYTTQNSAIVPLNRQANLSYQANTATIPFANPGVQGLTQYSTLGVSDDGTLIFGLASGTLTYFNQAFGAGGGIIVGGSIPNVQAFSYSSSNSNLGRSHDIRQPPVLPV